VLAVTGALRSARAVAAVALRVKIQLLAVREVTVETRLTAAVVAVAA
jgi:hypothetical protein